LRASELLQDFGVARERVIVVDEWLGLRRKEEPEQKFAYGISYMT
jgi:hypothetical protein